MPGGSQITEDGDINQNNKNSHNGINFVSRLQQFEQMQHRHRLHAKSQAQSHSNSTSTLTKVVFFLCFSVLFEFIDIVTVFWHECLD